MATEEDHPSLYSALYDAITDHELIGDLLQHPEFRRKAGQICREIASPEGGEELLQQACLRVLECASDLDLDTIRGEGEFFRWFSRLARLLYVSKALSVAVVNRCTEGAGFWPDSTDDVPPDDIGRFLAHADACPYHMRILRAEDEVLRAAFNRARGLDSQGRILLGDELKASIAKHRRHLQSWCEGASRKGTPFGRLVLFNGGREVASCGEFYEFSIHKSQHELDPYAGLQICVTSSDKLDENVLLGFYNLAGVCHTGEEHLLELKNGYTVGLRMKQLGETIFDIHFRCVETKKIEPEPVVDDDGPIPVEPPNGRCPDVSPVTPALPLPLLPGQPVTPGPRGWWPLSQSMQAGAIFALLLLLTFPIALLAGKKWGQMEKGMAAVAEVTRTPAGTVMAVSAPSAVPPAEAAVSPTPVKATQQPTPIPRVQTSAATREEPQPPKADYRRPRGSALQAPVTRPTPVPTRNSKPSAKASTFNKEPLRSAASRLAVDTSKANRAASRTGSTPAKSGAEVDDQRATTQLFSYDGQGRLNDKSALQIRTAAGRRRTGAAYPSANSMLNIATSDVLARKLLRALQDEGLHVEPVVNENPTGARYKVVWDAHADSSRDRGRFTVKLNVYIFREGETNSDKDLSYEGAGTSGDAAYDRATKKALTEVLKWIRRDSGHPLGASASDNSGVKRPRPTLPEPDSTDVVEQN